VGSHVRLSISDTGHGIDRGSLDRIFEPFYTTRAVGKGTGLGLSVVHGIAVAHHGDITVDSEPGKGTTFRVYLPEIKPAMR
jgi:signal transduction histidine kinase